MRSKARSWSPIFPVPLRPLGTEFMTAGVIREGSKWSGCWMACQQKSTARLIIITGYTPDYAAHAKVLAEYKGLGPVTTLHKPVEISALRAILGPEESC